MPTIFDYIDYRKFLEDLYKNKKAVNPCFSYQNIAEKMGINKGLIYNIIKGKRNLSKSNLLKICESINLNKTESEYLENLVNFNQAKSVNEKNHYFEKLNHTKNKHGNKMQLVRKDQYEFYSIWYHSVIRSIIDMYKFNGDFKWLANIVHPPINIKQAKHSVELLLKLEMIQKQKDGSYKVTNKNITTGTEISGLAIQNFHLECAELSKKAICDLDINKRNISGLTIGISNSSYARICKEILQFQNRIAEIVNEDSMANNVYQLNFHLFPMSKSDDENMRKT